MNCYFFCLGRIVPLCQRELQSILKVDSLELVNSCAWVESDKSVDCEAYQWASGGTIKCGKELAAYPADTSFDQLTDYCTEILQNEVHSSQLVFGISVFNIPDSYTAHDLLVAIKKKLKEVGVSTKFVEAEGNSEVLSSAQSLHEVVRKGGTELVISYAEGAVRVGKVLAVQQLEEWSEYDYGRPARRIKEGMLPPKLARMMINIALGSITHRQDTPLILDPFCGSGTVLFEAARIGCYATGVDISEDSVLSAWENLQWYARKTSEQKKPYSIHPFFDYFFTKSIDKKSVRVGDATHIAALYSPESIDCIVTEPFMGRLIGEKLPYEVLKNRMKGLEKLYIGFLKSAHGILKPGGVIVFTEPFFMIDKRVMYGKLIDKLTSLGYTLVYSPIEYQRERTIVGRRILVMKKE